MAIAALAASPCPISRSLAVLGEKWTLLVVRDALQGRTRFADFRASLGVAPDVLTDRLQTLVEAGILARQAYREDGQRERTEYVLTDAGRELTPVLAALADWGRHHRAHDPDLAIRFVDTRTTAPVRLTFVDQQDRPVSPTEISLVRGTTG